MGFNNMSLQRVANTGNVGYPQALEAVILNKGSLCKDVPVIPASVCLFSFCSLGQNFTSSEAEKEKKTSYSKDWFVKSILFLIRQKSPLTQVDTRKIKIKML